MTLRPEAAWVDGQWQRGLELDWEAGVITEIRATRKPSERFWLSPAFVNAHSHLEYRHLQGALDDFSEYWSWIRALTERKRSDSAEEVQRACRMAAQENLRAGVGLIGEHSDRPGAFSALAEAGVQTVGFVEVLTFASQDPLAHLATKQSENPDFRLAPHAPHTVHECVLRAFAAPERYSMHVAETDLENVFFASGTGPIAELYARYGVERELPSQRVIPYLIGLGIAHEGAQWVHVCAIHSEEVEMMADVGVSVAHCPRSNVRLGCPPCPVRQLRAAGIKVGLGLDSAASSGPIDMFAEMRAAREVALERGEPLDLNSLWQIVTEEGAQTLGIEDWKIGPGSTIPLITFVPNPNDLLSTSELKWVTE